MRCHLRAILAGRLQPCRQRSRLSPPPTSLICRGSQVCGLATAAAGIAYKNRTDVLLALFDKGTAVAGVFTKSKCPSAAVDWCRAKLKGGEARALVVNSGNANAFTGKTGKQSYDLDRIDRRESGRHDVRQDLSGLDRRHR